MTVFSGKHQSCPLCGGKDRFRYTEHGQVVCNQCMPETLSPIEFVMRVTGKTKQQIVRESLGAPASGGYNKPRAALKSSNAVPVELGAPLDVSKTITCLAQKTGKPITVSYESVYKWYDQHQQHIGYIGRKADKTSHLLYVQDGQWTQGTFDNRPLYGSYQKSKVLVVEGEKTRDAAARLLADTDVDVVTSVLGAMQAGKSDWSVLRGKQVWIWPDADDVGERYARQVARLIGTDCSIVPLVSGVSAGWDLADAEIEGWTAFDVLEQMDKASLIETIEEGIERVLKPLGYDQETFYYFPTSQMQVRSLNASEHSRNNLLSMLDESSWVSEFGNKWTDVAPNCLMMLCRSKGVYNAESVRGRGAWRDAGRVVFHCGDCLIVDGQEQPLGTFKSEYVYEKQPALGLKGEASAKDLEGIYTACNGLRWENPESGHLLAGMLVSMAIGGALKWRPHQWLSGERGCGKSTILSQLIFMVLGKLALRVQGDTTEAGLRQALKNQSLPVVFDEAEATGEAEYKRMQKILALARGSSSETQMVTMKGTAGQDAPMMFNIRSCFLFASINTSIKEAADESRITVLRLKTAESQDLEEKERIKKQYDLWCSVVEEFDPDLWKRFVRYCVNRIPDILKRIDEVTLELREKHSARRADQMAALFGCASLFGDVELKMFDLGKEDVDVNTGSTSEKVVEQWLTSIVRVPDHGDRSFATLLTSHSDTLHDFLQEYGVKVKHGLVYIYPYQASLVRFLSQIGIYNFHEHLSRLKGVETLDGQMRIGAGVYRRVLTIPLKMLPNLGEY